MNRALVIAEAAGWTLAFAALLLAALSMMGCSGFGGGVQRVDAVTTCESWGRHHARLLLGPKAVWAGGASVHAYGGRQWAVYAPGEEHVSSRAPRDEWQGGVEVTVPLWRQR